MTSRTPTTITVSVFKNDDRCPLCTGHKYHVAEEHNAHVAVAQRSGTIPPPYKGGIPSQRPERGAFKAEACRSCRQPVWFGKTINGSACPFNIIDGIATSVSHFATCPEAPGWSKGRKNKRRS